MVATVKIIPFSTERETLDAALAALGGLPAVSVAPFRPLRVGVVSTCCRASRRAWSPRRCARSRRVSLRPARASSSLTRRRLMKPVRSSLRSSGSPKAPTCWSIFGASAITDRRDVIPAAIEAFGGRIERFGMPVDPGNLLLLAARGDLPIIGAPGCARSPKENGFDWVLQRLIAGTPISGADIRAMGVGGLLMEIASRPQPREPHD